MHTPSVRVQHFCKAVGYQVAPTGAEKKNALLLRGFLFLLIGAASVAMLPGDAFAITIFSGSLSAASPTTTGGRLFRNGVPSGCGAVKTFPTTSSGAFQYQTTTYANTGPARCVSLPMTGVP